MRFVGSPLAATTTLFLLLAPVASAQDDDPLKGTTKLGDASEILLLWAHPEDEGTHVQTFYDYLNLNNPDPNVPNELRPQETQMVSSASVTEYGAALDAIAGDFDGDGVDDYVAAWEGLDRSIEMIIPDLDRENLEWTSPNLTTVADAGSVLDDPNFIRIIRLAAGDFDEDRASEFLLGYWGNDGALNIRMYETSTSKTPVLLSSFSDPDLTNFAGQDVPAMVERSSRWFDVNAGDFDGDGTDEVIVAAGIEADCAFSFGCWSVVARVYDVHPESFQLIRRAETTLFTKENNSSEFLNRIAVEPGRYGPEFAESAAIVFQQTTNESNTQWFLKMSRVLLAEDEDGAPLDPDSWGSAADTSRFATAPGGSGGIHGTLGNRGWALGAEAADFHQDGIDELVLHYRQLEIYEMDEDLSPTRVSSLSGGSNNADVARHALAVADLDADNDLANDESDWRPEIAVVHNQSVSDDGGITNDGQLVITVYEYSDETGFNGRELARCARSDAPRPAGRRNGWSGQCRGRVLA